MDYRYLKAFLLTAEYSSFSKAADVLKIAQSAVSRQIRLLEEALGEELIIRSSKKVVLTSKGQELFVISQRFDKASKDIFNQNELGPMKIGLLHGLLKNWFAPKMARYAKKSNRHIEITVAGPKQLRQDIEEGRLDIVFSTENIQSELISSLKLFDERLVLISKEEVNKKRLHEYKWIAYSEEDNIFKTTRKKSDSIIIVEDIHTIVDLVKNNVGVAVVPDHVLKKSDSLFIEEINQQAKSEVFMTTLNYKKMPAHIKEVQDLAQR